MFLYNHCLCVAVSNIVTKVDPYFPPNVPVQAGPFLSSTNCRKAVTTLPSTHLSHPSLSCVLARKRCCGDLTCRHSAIVFSPGAFKYSTIISLSSRSEVDCSIQTPMSCTAFSQSCVRPSSLHLVICFKSSSLFPQLGHIFSTVGSYLDN